MHRHLIRPNAIARLALACLLVGARPARGDTLYGLDVDGAWQTAAGDTRLAETFSTGGLRMTLDSVSVWVRNAAEDNDSAGAGTLTLSLYATDGDKKPTGSALTTIGSQYFEAFGDGKPVFSDLNYTLSANSTYAVVFQGSAGSTISWKYPGSGSISTSISPTPTFRDWASFDNGASWGDANPPVGFNMTVNASNAATPFTWTGGGSSNDWSDAANWSGAVPVSSSYAELVFAGSSRTTNTNNLGNWRDVGRIQFASGAGSFTLGGDTIGFRPYLDSGEQQIIQNSANTQTIAIGAFSFRNNTDSAIRLNAGDLVINSSDLYIDMNNDAWRTLYVTGDDQTRRTVTFAGNVNKGGAGRDPDLVIQNNKRVLVTGSLNNGSGNDGSVFIDNGVLEFGGAGGMTGGSPVVGASSGSANAALLLGTGGATFGRQIEIRGGASGQRIVGGANTSGTATFSGRIYATNSPGDYDLKATTGGAVNFSGTRDLDVGLRVNRAEGATGYGGTVILSGSTTSSSWTALYGGTLEFGDWNRLGTSHFEFDAAAGDSGTLRYTGGSTTTTKTLWIDNPGITRAAIDVSEAGTTLTWNPGEGNRSQNVTKTGAGRLVFGGGIGGGTVRVEAGVLELTASNGYGGGTTLDGGTLVLGHADAIGSSGTISFGGGTLQYTASNTADYSSRFSSAAGQQYRIDTNGRNVTLGSALASSGGSLAKLGSGRLTLTAANSYTGTTSVVAGELALLGAVAGDVFVLAGATLSGTGTVGGDATIAGVHSPGTSPGTQTFNGDLTYQAGAVVNWELIGNTTGSPGVSYDRLVVPSGNLTFSGPSTLALSFNGAGSTVDWANPFWNANRSWTIFDLSTGLTSGLGNLILGGSLLDSSNNPLSPTSRGYFTISLTGQDVVLNFVSVPEPSAACVAIAGLACCGWIARRRARR